MKRLFPDDPGAYKGLTTLYLQTGKFDKIEQNLKDGIQKQPQNTSLYLLLSDFYRQTERAKDAESLLKNAVSTADAPLDIEASLADLYLATGKTEHIAQQELDAIFAKDRKSSKGQNLWRQSYS